MKTSDLIPINTPRGIALSVWYDRENRCWWACYRDSLMNQLGDAWHGATRDEVLVWRPALPPEETVAPLMTNLTPLPSLSRADFHALRAMLAGIGVSLHIVGARFVASLRPLSRDELEVLR